VVGGGRGDEGTTSHPQKNVDFASVMTDERFLKTPFTLGSGVGAQSAYILFAFEPACSLGGVTCLLEQKGGLEIRD
jgi:hypothetical protein